MKIIRGGKMNSIDNALGALWASKIKKYSVDFLNNSMFFELETIDFEATQNHTLEICQISALCYFNNTKDSIDKIWTPEPDDYLELTSISHINRTEQVIKSIDEKWAEQYGGTFNMCLELWSNMIFVSTTLIKIDGVSYEI